MRVTIVLFVFTYIIVSVTGCDPDQYHNGCMIKGITCKCGYGCKADYVYKTRRACRDALKVQERTPSAGYGAGSGYAGYSGAAYVPNYGATYSAGYASNYDLGYSAGNERTLGLTQPTAISPSPPRSSDICSNLPCSRGICIQTANEPGFACKCEGTGFYGQRCEKGAPDSHTCCDFIQVLMKRATWHYFAEPARPHAVYRPIGPYNEEESDPCQLMFSLLTTATMLLPRLLVHYGMGRGDEWLTPGDGFIVPACQVGGWVPVVFYRPSLPLYLRTSSSTADLQTTSSCYAKLCTLKGVLRQAAQLAAGLLDEGELSPARDGRRNNSVVVMLQSASAAWVPGVISRPDIPPMCLEPIDLRSEHLTQLHYCDYLY